MSSKKTVDLIVAHAKQLLTLSAEGRASGSRSRAHDDEGPRRGQAMRELGIISDGALSVKEGRIVAVGQTEELLKSTELRAGGEFIDASGRVVCPGFVDSHTHAVFAGNRAEEFEARLAGVSYQEIAGKGGGILSSVRAFRAATREALFAGGLKRLDKMLQMGTTTVEIKSGYGLSCQDEVKALEVIGDVSRAHPVDVVATFLGAHEFPEEFKQDREAYVKLVAEEQVPEVARRGLAEFCDVFCEKGVFTVDESRRILTCGKDHGLLPKIHAEEFANTGGALLAAELGAVSADHLLHATKSDMKARGDAGVIAVLLPGTSFSLALDRYADARQMMEVGSPVALATDCNPGSSMTESMQIIITLACVQMRMTASEAIVASTINGAFAVGRGKECGSLDAGKKADFLVLDMEDYRELSYHYGVSNVEHVIKHGKVVVRSGAVVWR